MAQIETLVAEAAILRQRFESTLAEAGLTMDALSALAGQLRHRLPAAEIQRVEAAKRAIVPQPRCMPGTSSFVLPIGIRG